MVTLTVYFEDPWWVGVVEMEADGELRVARQVFGSEPPNELVHQFVLRELPRVHLNEGSTVNDLLRLLRIPTEHGRPLVSVNGFYQRDDATLSDGDRVQLLRTVVGG